MVWISIEGNIGSGKSRLINSLRQNEEIYNKFTRIHPEPVSEWNGELNDFYNASDKSKYAFPLIMRIFLSQIKMTSTNFVHLLTERCSLSSVGIFSKLKVDENLITPTEYKIHKDYYNLINKDPTHFIYLKATPETCYSRILNRKDNIPVSIEYLDKIQKYHEFFFKNININIKIINSEQSPEQVLKEVTQYIQEIFKKF
jgi:deoxyadenosine/deoxycytidine kinase